MDRQSVQQFITFHMANLQAKLNRQAATILRNKAGLTLIQWRILVLVGDRGRTTAGEITASGLIDKGLFSRKLKSLVADGLIQSELDEHDHRIQHLSLTPLGQNTHDTVMPVMMARQKHLKASFTDTELKVLFTAFEKLDRAAEATDF